MINDNGQKESEISRDFCGHDVRITATEILHSGVICFQFFQGFQRNNRQTAFSRFWATPSPPRSFFPVTLVSAYMYRYIPVYHGIIQCL